MAGLLSQRGLVGPLRPAAAERDGFGQHLAAKRLRGLGEEHRLACHRPLHDAVSATDRVALAERAACRRPLDRVARREGDDRRAGLGRGVDGRLNRRGVDERPGRVVNQHDVGHRRHRVEPVGHRVLAPRSAGDEPNPFPAQALGRRVDPLGRHDDDQVGDAPAREERVEAPLEHRPAAEVEQLLGHTRAQALPAASGGDDGGYVHGRLPTTGSNL